MSAVCFDYNTQKKRLPRTRTALHPLNKENTTNAVVISSGLLKANQTSSVASLRLQPNLVGAALKKGSTTLLSENFQTLNITNQNKLLTNKVGVSGFN